ncbi:MAG: beta-propeller fold lactonase family protein, partial [Methylocella sp.]
MYRHNRNGRRAEWARGLMALFALLPMGLGAMVRPAEAAPFAYLTNEADNNVSVIDTATNTVEAATLAVGNEPNAIAVTSDGLHAYVANGNFFGLGGTVSVIDTATNTVEAATLAVGSLPRGVAVTPDGKHAYVVNDNYN